MLFVLDWIGKETGPDWPPTPFHGLHSITTSCPPDLIQLAALLDLAMGDGVR